MPGTILYVENLTVSFSGFKALNNLNFCVRYGELRFLIGPNGAGKTTLLDVVCGRIKPDGGRVIFKEDVDIAARQEHELVMLGISRKFQTPAVFSEFTVMENMEISLRYRRGVLPNLFHRIDVADRAKIEHVLEEIGLSDKTTVKAGVLSHGEKQRLEIGMLLVQEPDLMLLDEPVAGLTKQEKKQMGELLQTISDRCSILVVEHDMSFVRRFARRVTVMHEGRVLCEGDMNMVQEDPQVVEVYLGRGGCPPC